MAGKEKCAARASTGAGPTAREAADAAAALGQELDAGQAQALAAYLGLLAAWNRRMNLVGPEDWREVLNTLVVDSFHLARFLARPPAPLPPLPESPRTLDLGAGAGLPGIPLRILWQAGDYALVEPREKRALFLGLAAATLRLPSTRVLRCRVEELPADSTPADIVLSRAFRPWPEFLATAAPLLAPRGLAVVLANDPAPPQAAHCAGLRLMAQADYPVAMPSGETRRYSWFFMPENMDR